MESHELYSLIRMIQEITSVVDQADGYDPIEIEHGWMAQALDEIEDIFKQVPELQKYPNLAQIKELVDTANSRGLNINYAMNVEPNPEWNGESFHDEVNYVPVDVSEEQFKELHSIMSLMREKATGALAYAEELETEEDLEFQDNWREGLEQGKDAWRTMTDEQRRTTLEPWHKGGGMIKGFAYSEWDERYDDEMKISQILDEENCVRFLGIASEEDKQREVYVIQRKELAL